MPRIPIIPPREFRAGGAGGGPGPEALPPEQADALQALEARTARIDRELAVSQSWSAAVDRLAHAEDAEDGPPPGFTRSFLEEADKERAAMLKILPPDRQGELEQDLLSLRSDFAERAASAEASGLALRRRSGLYRALDGYRAGVARDPGLFDEAVMRMDSLSSDLGLPEDRLSAMRREVRDVLGNGAIDGIMEDPDRAARVLSDGLFDDVLSEASKTRRLSEAQTEASRRKLLSREQSVSGLAVQARQGTAPDEAILKAERDGVLAHAEAVHLRQVNAQAAEEASLRLARIERVTMATELFDPADPEDHAAVSAYWESVSEVHASDDPAEQKERELGFIGRTGILPDGLSRKYQGALLSIDPTLAVSGATALADLQKTNPALVGDIPPERMRKAAVIAEFAVLDLPPERAVELAEQDIETQSIEPEVGSEPFVPTDRTDAVVSPARNDETPAGEPVDPAAEDDFAPDEDPAAVSDSNTDQTDGPFGFNGDLQEDGKAQEPVEDGADRESDAEPFRDDPDWSEIEGLGEILEAEGDEAFATAAEEAGLNPDVARLFAELIHAKPEDRQDIFERIDKEYGQGYGVLLKPLISERVLRTEDPEKRKTFLAPYLWQLRNDAPLQLGIGAVLGGGLFGPGVRQRGGRRKPQTKGPVRQPGPARRGDFAPGPVGQREWNEMQQRIRTGLPRGFKSLEGVRGLASTFQKQMAASGNPHARLAIRGSAVTNRSFDDKTGKYTGHRFDHGERSSDLDFAIVDGSLFSRAVEAGIRISPNGTRTNQLKPEDLRKLGLLSMAQSVGKVVGERRHSFVLYGSENAIADRGPMMWFLGGTK